MNSALSFDVNLDKTFGDIVKACVVLCSDFACKLDWLDEIWVFILIVILLLYFVEKDDSNWTFQMQYHSPNAVCQYNSICIMHVSLVTLDGLDRYA